MIIIVFVLQCFERALEQCEEEETQLVHQLEDMSLQDVPMAATTTGGNISEPEENDEISHNTHQVLVFGSTNFGLIVNTFAISRYWE